MQETKEKGGKGLARASRTEAMGGLYMEPHFVMRENNVIADLERSPCRAPGMRARTAASTKRLKLGALA